MEFQSKEEGARPAALNQITFCLPNKLRASAENFSPLIEMLKSQ